MTHPATRRGLLAACAAAHAAAVLGIAAGQFPTRNEVAHVPAGLSYLADGRFHLYRVNPPLTRLAQAVPVWLAGADLAAVRDVPDGPGLRNEWAVARAFADRNADRYLTLMLLARLPGVGWSLLGLWLVWWWAGRLYGDRAALLAAVLWSSGPNVLAHAALATPDLPCAVLCLAAAVALHRYLRAPSAGAAYLAGLALGLAQLAKFTALVDYAVWAGLALAGCAAGPPAFRGLPARRKAGHAAVVVGTSLAVINLGYGGEGALTPLGRFDFVSRTVTADDGEVRRNAFAGSWLGRVPVPLPANYVRGLDLQQADFERGRRSYLRGEWRDHGWWYYYLYALAVKVPVGTLVLGAAGAALAVAPRFRRFDELVVWGPAVALFAVASAKTGYTMHFRYVLPALPFALVGLSKAAEAGGRWVRVLVAAVAASVVASSAAVYPHSLSYFNEPAGGPARGDAHLVDSNLDWGQDLLRLRAWHDGHPEARPLYLACDHYVDPRLAGLPALARPPAGRPPGYYALDVESLHAGGYESFRWRDPVARVGWSIRVYHVAAGDPAGGSAPGGR